MSPGPQLRRPTAVRNYVGELTISSLPNETFQHAAKMARYAAGAEYAEIVMSGELAVGARSIDPAHEGTSELLTEASPLADTRCGPIAAYPHHGLPDWVASFAVAPLSGPSGDAGWIAVASSHDNLHPDTLDRLDSAVFMVEDHLDRNVERIRMKWLGATLRENQNQLQRSTERLEASNRQLEQFAYIASHELVAPLRVVSVYAQLLEQLATQETTDRARLAACVSEIKEGVSAMSTQVKSLLELSAVDANTTSLEPVDVDDVVHAAIDTLSEVFAEADPVEIRVGELPIVVAQPVPFQSVFANLFTNSVRYRHPDRPLEISVTARSETRATKRETIIEVRDNGRGIDLADQDSVFDLFDRGSSTDTTGSGIGLALSRRIVEAFGGTIGLDPNTVDGTTFLITLPSAA